MFSAVWISCSFGFVSWPNPKDWLQVLQHAVRLLPPRSSLTETWGSFSLALERFSVLGGRSAWGLGRTARFWASCPWPSASYSSRRRGKGTPRVPSAISLCLTVAVPVHLDRPFVPALCFPLPRKLKEKKINAGSSQDGFWPLRRFLRIDVAASGFRDKNFLETRKRPPLLYKSDQNGPWPCLLSFSRGWPRFCELGTHTPGPWPVRELPHMLIPRPFTGLGEAPLPTSYMERSLYLKKLQNPLSKIKMSVYFGA